MKRRLARTIVAAVAFIAAGAIADTPDALELSAREAMKRGDFAAASEAYSALADARPGDAVARYNLACALTRLGELDAAADALHDAVARGFVRFFRMERDEDMAALRSHPGYRALIDNWREVLDARGRADREAAMEALRADRKGGVYRGMTDAWLRVNLVSALDESSLDAARREALRVAAFTFEKLFPAPDPTDPRADPWVTIVLPTPEDFARFAPVPGVGGVYDHDRRTLVARDIGPSLRHEFMHALHHRRMDRLGQQHAFWVQEGLGALVEDLEHAADDAHTDEPAPSWRTNMARRLAAANRLTPWRTLFSLDADRFLGDRANANYAQARALLMHVESLGALQDFMRRYEETFHEDPTGALALEQALGAPINRLQREHRAWLLALPEVGDTFRPGGAWLGVVVEDGPADGVAVREVVVRERAAAESRLQGRDVILRVNGADVRTVDEYERVVSGLEPGRRVRVEVRRGSRLLAFDTTVLDR